MSAVAPSNPGVVLNMPFGATGTPTTWPGGPTVTALECEEHDRGTFAATGRSISLRTRAFTSFTTSGGV